MANKKTVKSTIKKTVKPTVKKTVKSIDEHIIDIEIKQTIVDSHESTIDTGIERNC